MAQKKTPIWREPDLEHWRSMYWFVMNHLPQLQAPVNHGQCRDHYSGKLVGCQSPDIDLESAFGIKMG
jgi:hypothetical protein